MTTCCDYQIGDSVIINYPGNGYRHVNGIVGSVIGLTEAPGIVVIEFWDKNKTYHYKDHHIYTNNLLPSFPELSNIPEPEDGDLI